MNNMHTLRELAALRRDELVAESSRTRRARAARTGRTGRTSHTAAAARRSRAVGSDD